MAVGTDAGAAAAGSEAAVGFGKGYLGGVGVAESTITAVLADPVPPRNCSWGCACLEVNGYADLLSDGSLANPVMFYKVNPDMSRSLTVMGIQQITTTNNCKLNLAPGLGDIYWATVLYPAICTTTPPPEGSALIELKVGTPVYPDTDANSLPQELCTP
jgi:hypothetical protein